MTDASSTPAIPVTIHRGDYRPPDWQVPDVALDFALAVEATRVAAALSVVLAWTWTASRSVVRSSNGNGNLQPNLDESPAHLVRAT